MKKPNRIQFLAEDFTRSNNMSYYLTLNTRSSFPLLRCGHAHLCLHTLVNTLQQVKQRLTSCCADNASVNKHFKILSSYNSGEVCILIIECGFPCRPALQHPLHFTSLLKHLFQLFFTATTPMVTHIHIH